MHDSQPGDGGSTKVPSNPQEELQLALNEQTKLNEEINQIIERQKSGAPIKEDAMRYTTIMNLMAQMGPRIMELWNQASQQSYSAPSGTSASSTEKNPIKQRHHRS